jgi:hypothetical protein
MSIALRYQAEDVLCLPLTINRILILLILERLSTQSAIQVASLPIKSNTCEDGSPEPSDGLFSCIQT